jgi:hypothetical protein
MTYCCRWKDQPKHCVALAGNTAMALLLLLLETAASLEFLATMEVALRGRKIRGKRSWGSVAERGQGTGGEERGRFQGEGAKYSRGLDFGLVLGCFKRMFGQWVRKPH